MLSFRGIQENSLNVHDKESAKFHKSLSTFRYIPNKEKLISAVLTIFVTVSMNTLVFASN